MAAWTDEDTEALKMLRAKGLSFGVIAQALGWRHSRNSVIGKAHRIGLRRTGPRPPSTQKNAERLFLGLPIQGGVTGPKKRPPPPPPVAQPPLVLEDGKRVTTLTLTSKTCRFPIGDPAEPGLHYCGHKPREGSPYCDYHSHLAFVPQGKKRPGRPSAADEDIEKAKAALKATGLARAFG